MAGAVRAWTRAPPLPLPLPSLRGLPPALLLLALALGSLDASGAVKWESCAPPGVPVVVQEVTMSPDPAVSGQNFTILLPALAGEALDGGSVGVYVTYYGIPVHVSSEDLCLRTPCPVAVGPFTFSNTEFLPYITPAGRYVLWLKATGLGPSSPVLFCTKVSFSIVRPQAAMGRSRKEIV